MTASRIHSARCIPIFLMLALPMFAQVHIEYDRFADVTTFSTRLHHPDNFRWKVRIMALAQCPGNVEACSPGSEVSLGFRVQGTCGRVVKFRFDGRRSGELAGDMDISLDMLIVKLAPDKFRQLVSSSLVEAQISGPAERTVEIRFSAANLYDLKALADHLR